MEWRTARLTLRPLGLEDLESTYAYSSDREAVKYMMFLPDDSMEETRLMLQEAGEVWAKGEPSGVYRFAILEKGRHIGEIDLYLEEGPGIAELGWVLHRDFWGKGIVPEATAAVMEYAGKTFDIYHFFATCDSENEASLRVMEKLGMTLTDRDRRRKNKSSEEERREYRYDLVLDPASV